MEIIKRGKIPEEKEAEGTCHNCGTVIRAKRSEGKTIYDQRDGDYVRLACPVCTQTITITLSKFK